MDTHSIFTRCAIEGALFNLLPEIMTSEYPSICRSHKTLQSRSAAEQNEWRRLLPRLALNPDSALNHRPTVWVASHTGPYRLILPFLIINHAPILTIIDRRVAESQQSVFENELDKFGALQGINRSRYGFVDSADRTAVLQLVRWLRRGGSVLIYMDGNIGIDGLPSSELITVPFLSSQVYSRTGPARVAQMGRAALSFIHAKRVDDSDVERWPVRVSPISDCGTADVTRDIPALWQELAAIVRAHPASWESLRYAYRYIVRRAEPGPVTPGVLPDRLIFNSDRYVFVDEGTVPVIIDRLRMSQQTVGAGLARLFGETRNGGYTNSDRIGMAMAKALMERQILIGASE
jgi:hypothetical protein